MLDRDTTAVGWRQNRLRDLEGPGGDVAPPLRPAPDRPGEARGASLLHHLLSKPSTLLGRITGALSVVNLLRDLLEVPLFGRLEQWVATYRYVIAQLTDFAFGWINGRWFRVSHSEGHVLILALLVAMAEARATRSHEQSQSPNATGAEAFLASLGTSFVFRIYPILLIAIVLPTPWGE
jgi:hypothetical protein